MRGGPNADELVPGAARDDVRGGMGNDRVTLSFDQARDFIDCGTGRDTIAYVKRVDPKDVAVNCETQTTGSPVVPKASR